VIGGQDGKEELYASYYNFLDGCHCFVLAVLGQGQGRCEGKIEYFLDTV
jgi:hypothetical protein